MTGLAALAACNTSVRPAPEAAAQAFRADPGLPVEAFATRRGFDALTPPFDGPVPATGRCWEKARSTQALLGGGVHVVRICSDAGGAMVFAMHTHGDPWHEHYPSDRSADLTIGGGSNYISNQTLERLAP